MSYESGNFTNLTTAVWLAQRWDDWILRPKGQKSRSRRDQMWSKITY